LSLFLLILIEILPSATNTSDMTLNIKYTSESKTNPKFIPLSITANKKMLIKDAMMQVKIAVPENACIGSGGGVWCD
jgi:hypothetical protein